jgi:hypothetical protein
VVCRNGPILVLLRRLGHLTSENGVTSEIWLQRKKGVGLNSIPQLVNNSPCSFFRSGLGLVMITFRALGGTIEITGQ